MLSLALATSAAMTAAAFAGATTQPKGLPITFTLPSGWSQTATATGDRFDAVSAAGVKLAVQTGGTYPMSVPFTFFVKTETSAATNHYKSEDPHASVSGRKITLPSGQAVLIRAIVHRGGTPTAIWIYSFLHNGVTYHFTFFAPGSSLNGGGASALAKSLHFKK